MNRRRLVVACAPGGIFIAVAVLVALAVAVLALGSYRGTVAEPVSAKGVVSSPTPFTQPEVPVMAAYHHLPLIFEPNQGQSDPEVKFLAHGNGYGLFLTATQAVLTLRHSVAGASQPAPQFSVVRMSLERARANSTVSGTDELPGKSNYFIGNDPAKWHTDVPQFARVRYHGVYPGVDLVYYGKQGQLEYDFEVSPGGDPGQVALRFQGARTLSIDAAGNLVLAVGGGDVTLEAPRVYQRFGDEERKVDGRFELRGRGRVGFSMGEYDRSRTLVIDPILTYSTYLGGSGDEACTVILGVATGVSGCPAIAVDTSLNAYIAGSTMSADFPKAGTPFQAGLAGTANVFVAKFNNTANTLVFSTYLGGNTVDTTAGLAVDAGSNVIVAGNTTSSNFPTHGTNQAFQATRLSSNKHAFLSKLDSLGHTLIYSTYLSGNGVDTATGLALDLGSSAYITGTTTSTEVQSGFPSTLGAFQISPKASSQFFLTKVNPSLSGQNSVVYSTYFGGSAPSNGETMGGGVAVDVNSNVYITGGTNFTDMPVLNAFQGTLAGGLDVFVASLNPAAVTGTQLLYSTYLGGTSDDIGYGIAVDSALNAYVTGSTTSTNFPAAGTGVFQPAQGGGTDAFVAKLGPVVTTGNNVGTVPLNYFSYLGGASDDVGLGIIVDNSGQVFGGSQGARITGWTASADFPVRNNPVQAGFGGGHDAFVARIDTTATSSDAPGHYATFLGGNNDDFGTGIAVDVQGASYVAGETKSANFLIQAPPQNASFQPSLNGGSDAFLSKLGPLLALKVTVTTSPGTTVSVGNQVTFTYTIENDGDFASGITFTDTLQTGSTFVSATTSTSSNACGQPSGGTIVCNIGALNSGGTGETGGTATVTIILTPIANTTPQTSPTSMSNSGSVSVAGSTFTAGSGATVTVNDFSLSVAPSSATVPAGVPAQFTATVTPTGFFPSTVSVNCSSGLPTAATCSETTGTFQNLNGPVSTDVIINTVARVTTTTHLFPKGGPLYAMGLPVFGLVGLGLSMGSFSRTRRALMGLLLSIFFALIVFQAGCGSSGPVTSTVGTLAGTYVVTITAVSGSATRTQTVTLVVQ